MQYCTNVDQHENGDEDNTDNGSINPRGRIRAFLTDSSLLPYSSACPWTMCSSSVHVLDTVMSSKTKAPDEIVAKNVASSKMSIKMEI